VQLFRPPVLPTLTRRKFLFTGTAAAIGTAAWGADGFAESNHPRLVQIEIPLARLPESFDGFRLVQLSDFHYEDHYSAVPIRRSIAIVNNLRPDLAVFTGDFVTVPVFDRALSVQEVSASSEPCAAMLSEISGLKYAILGNHDAASYPGRIIHALEQAKIPVLRNQSVPIERGRDRIWLAGIDDLLRGMPDMSATLSGIPEKEATILLAHEPDFADDVSLTSVDLQLSGHSHGGQIWIPGIGAPWLPAMARRYPRGLNKIGNLTLYTNIGIGTIRAPIRINCPPEITLVTLRASKS
jgi:predicted MPP superfamily phosphohydrolase